jgi:hypothetical protein
VRDIVRSIAAQTGQRILIAPEVTGNVAVSLNAVPLETALSAVTKTTGNQWSRIEVPAAAADSLTAEQAVALARAADALAAGAVSVRSSDGREVTVGAATARPAKTEAVYLVRTVKDPEALRAERTEEEKKKEAEAQGTNLNLSEDAKKDPAVVSAYSTLRGLSPDQLALVTREFITHITPDEQQALEQSMAKQRDQMRSQPPQQ